MTNQETCAERVSPSAKYVDGEIRRMLDEVYSGAEDPELYNYGLSLDWSVKVDGNDESGICYVWLLSWGGPSQEIRAFFRPMAREPYRVEYWFLDWFDGACVSAGPAMREAMEYFLESAEEPDWDSLMEELLEAHEDEAATAADEEDW